MYEYNKRVSSFFFLESGCRLAIADTQAGGRASEEITYKHLGEPPKIWENLLVCWNVWDTAVMGLGGAARQHI